MRTSGVVNSDPVNEAPSREKDKTREREPLAISQAGRCKRQLHMVLAFVFTGNHALEKFAV
jgi:hypothetical protein